MEHESTQTTRQRILSLLEQGPLSLKELAAELRIRLKDTSSELDHVACSLAPRKIVVEPAVCERCGYTFRKRQRWTTPSRCPQCRCERISPPLFSLPLP